jgi:hypothetical protein
MHYFGFVDLYLSLHSFDNDILDLMDELDFDLMFKEITGSICDPEKFTAYMTERTAILVERFLVSLHSHSPQTENAYYSFLSC